MKIKFEMANGKTRAMTDRIMSEINTCGFFEDASMRLKFEKGVNRAVEDFTCESEFITSDFAGGTYQYGKNSATLYIDDDAVVDIVLYMIKVATTFQPLINCGRTAVSILKGLKASVSSMSRDFTRKFNEKYGSPESFAVTEIHSDDLDLHAYVAIRNDGYDHWSVFRSTFIVPFCNSEHLDSDEIDKIIMQLFTKELQRRKTPISFETITRDQVHMMFNDYFSNIDAEHLVKDDDAPEEVDKCALVFSTGTDNDHRVLYAMLDRDHNIIECGDVYGGDASDPYHDMTIDIENFSAEIARLAAEGKFSYEFHGIHDMRESLGIITKYNTHNIPKESDERVQQVTVEYTYRNGFGGGKIITNK